MKDFISSTQWISWIAATSVAAATMGSYIHATFPTKVETREENREQKAYIEKRLDRMENKFDRIENKLDELLSR